MVEVSTPTRWVLRLLAVGYVFFLVAWPTGLLAYRTFEEGTANLLDTLQDPDVQSALLLTGKVALVAVLINLVFGVTISILLVRYEFPGKRLLSALIDVPLSVSPVVVGLALVLVYNGRDGWFGPTLEDAGFPVIFHHAGSGHGDDVRRPAAGDPRGRPRAAPRSATTRSRRRAASGRTRRRPSGGSRCPASSGRSSTASCSPRPARSVSSARSRSCRATSRGKTQTATLMVEKQVPELRSRTRRTRSRSSWSSSASPVS